MSARGPALALLAALGLCAGCSEPTPQVGGNTNWLRACDDDAECGELTCLCGRCSLACDDGAGCSAYPGATCARGLAGELQCGQERAGGLCLLGCATDDDCDGELACVQGACVQRAPAPLCPAHPEALLCSGFDSASLPEWAITGEPDSTLAAAESPRHAGRSALEARVATFNGRSRFIASFPPQTSGTLYLRVWMFVPRATLLENVHTITVGNGDTSDWGVNLEFYRGALAVETPTLPPAGEGVTVPLGRWFCVRAEIDLGDDAGAVRAWLDEEPAVALRALDTLPAAGARDLTVGIDHLAQEEPATVFFDELLLDLEPTSCAR